MSKLKIRFIVNPISGVGRQKIMPGLLEKHLDKDQFDYDIVYTERAGHAKELSSEAAQNGMDIVGIIGGDGSVNECGSGLLHSDTAMAIIPTGSGNGLALHLGIPTKLTEAIHLLNQASIRSIDTGTINGRPFMGVAGFGFDAHIADEFSRFGKRGFFSYFRIIIREYMRYKSPEVTYTVDGEEIKARPFLVTAANSSQYGNRATIAPTAQIDDGKLKLCILRRFPLIAAPFIAWRLFNKSIHKSKYMTCLDGAAFDLDRTDKLAHVDGEPFETDHKLHIEIVPSSLKVVVAIK